MQPVQTTFLALLLGHLLGDFPFQGQWILRNKNRGVWPLGCHGLIHYVLAWLCLGFLGQAQLFAFANQGVVLGYVLLHLCIDKAKGSLTERSVLADDGKTFLLDQALHGMTIAAASLLLVRSSLSEVAATIRLSPAFRVHACEAAIVYVATVFGGGCFIRYLTDKLKDDVYARQAGNTGLYVGWVERFLIVTAIVVQSPILVGLILTGKSIARFPEFKEARFAEYFLIGTLLSISISVVGGLLLLKLLYGTISLK